LEPVTQPPLNKGPGLATRLGPWTGSLPPVVESLALKENDCESFTSERAEGAGHNA